MNHQYTRQNRIQDSFIRRIVLGFLSAPLFLLMSAATFIAL